MYLTWNYDWLLAWSLDIQEVCMSVIESILLLIVCGCIGMITVVWLNYVGK